MKQSVLKYDVVFEEQEVGGYSVTVPALPGCISEGDTFEEAKTNISEAITAYLESMVKHGEKIPSRDTNILVEQIKVQRPTV